MNRREFIPGILGAAGLLIPSNGLGRYLSGTPISQEPKSIHTWLTPPRSDNYACDVDIRINRFPVAPDKRWLYYLSLQVNFTGHDEWSHGGIQWAGAKEFRDNNNKGINWGGGSDWAGYGGIGSTNTPFTWETGKWYRFRAWRLDKNEEGLYQWLFAVMDRASGVEKQYGKVVTKSEYIKNAVVFTETGYGVSCGTETVDVEWRDPVFRHPGGTSGPDTGTATYNGTCDGANSTQQGLISRNPLQWFHATNTRRTVAHNSRLW
ncbi:MAG: hypothetical protein DWQ47_10255 [Acidobacteria bacterium]|nr:MAG: hypothetical protein DWQ32_12670 [Acidobacteriota bacterium]REJ97967.1 MAG: hypothetical protein DWQ38_15470 [Acidobacteriota bacterium]REK16710.1 MAG: hypothetical protein DWQ43_00515 [Acidobacteriota bacterium]REK42621.1 MAG: hypothetical protein DWQ47_10255 [Acidobacteriota bacterium]